MCSKYVKALYITVEMYNKRLYVVYDYTDALLKHSNRVGVSSIILHGSCKKKSIKLVDKIMRNLGQVCGQLGQNKPDQATLPGYFFTFFWPSCPLLLADLTEKKGKPTRPNIGRS